MKTFHRILLGLGACGVLLIAGCSQDNSVNPMGPAGAGSDQAILASMMTGDQPLSSINPWIDNVEPIPPGRLDPVAVGYQWVRRGQLSKVSTTVDMVGDTFATITSTTTFNGTFRVFEDRPGPAGTFKYIDKPMYNTIVRKAHAIRNPGAKDPLARAWRITEVTPEVMVTSKSNPNAVEPAETMLFHGKDGKLTLLADITDPLNTYFQRDDPPTIDIGEDIVVMVRSKTTTPIIAVVRPQVFLNELSPRVAMHDDGVTPDQVAGDGLFSASAQAGLHTGIFEVGVDVLSLASVKDPNAEYDAGAWGIPYRVGTPLATVPATHIPVDN